MLVRKSGFTLIEVTLVLAIASALLTIIFAGQAQLRASVQFGSGIEKVANNISAVRNQSITTVSNGSGSSSTQQVLGQELLLTNASNLLTVNTLILDTSGAPTVTHPTAYTVTMPSGIKYLPNIAANTSVYFARAVLTGELLTFVSPTGSVFGYSSPDNYQKGSINNTTVGHYLFSDSGGTRFACISVNPSDGAVTSQIDIAKASCNL